MPGRKYDDTPAPGDPGMEDKPLPKLSPFGQQVYHTILHRELNLDCIPSATKRTFTFTSIDQFLKAVRGIATRLPNPKPVAKLALIDESIGGHTQWALTYPIREARTGEIYRLRISGDVVPRLLRAKILPIKDGLLLLDLAAPVSAERISSLLRALPQEEGAKQTAAPET